MPTHGQFLPWLYTGLITVVAVLQGCVLGTMTWRRLYRIFPVFYAYTAFNLARAATLYWVLYFLTLHRLRYNSYFYLYWTTDVIAIGMGLVIMYRVFAAVLEPYAALRGLTQQIFLLCVALFLVAALLMSRMAAFPYGVLVSAISHFELAAAIVRCGTVLILFVFSSYLALSWQSRILGISLGCGLSSAVDLITWALATLYGVRATQALPWITAGGYFIPVVIWTIYFMRPERSPAVVGETTRIPVQNWNAALTELLNR